MTRVSGLILLLSVTLWTGPALADGTLRLPDLSRAIQSLIDERMSLALSRETAPAGETAEPATAPSTGRADRISIDSSARTDEPGWKPYHSAL